MVTFAAVTDALTRFAIEEPDKARLVQLRFFAGLSAREAAVGMGKQEGTVRGLQFRAIAALRRQLGIVPQEGFLFAGTVRENILLGAQVGVWSFMIRYADVVTAELRRMRMAR